MKLTYQGKPGFVTIGTRPLQPGDTITEADCDATSLERLASRSDFEKTAAPKKPKAKKEE